MRISFVGLGRPIGVNAAYKVVSLPTRKGMRSRLAKTEQAKQYGESLAIAGRQVMQRAGLLPFPGDVVVEIDIYFQSRRADIDGPLKQILDSLQVTKRGRLGAGVYKNDSQVKRLVLERYVDPDSPRVCVRVTEVGP
jgi:Holliday junction resolvase RusA-like endonuclease